jgi:pilus assembly protein CpaB
MFVTALVIAVGAAWVANNWLQDRLNPQEAKAQGIPTVVAALKIPFGHKIEGAHVRVIRMPEESVPGDAYADPEEVIGKIANQVIFPGEVLISKRIVDQLEGSTLSALIAPKKRAVTVRVNDVIGVAGFLLPGNRVDVVASSKVMDNLYVRTILQDIKVLAVDQTASPEKDQPLIVRAVTLELSPEESEILVKATNEGSVQLTLRNPMDKQKIAESEEEAELAQQAEVSSEMLEKSAFTLRDSGGIKLVGVGKPGLLPGSRVDVLAARAHSNGVTEDLLLRGVKVNAVFHNKGRSTLIGAVSLELTAPQARILEDRNTRGSVQLTLRPPTRSPMVAETQNSEQPRSEAPIRPRAYRKDMTGGPAMERVSNTL